MTTARCAPSQRRHLAVPCAVAGWMLAELWIVLALWVSANAFNMLDHADGTAASAGVGSLIVADGALGMSGAGVCLGFLAQTGPRRALFLAMAEASCSVPCCC